MADNEDQSSKTEDPTERKLTKLKEEGNVASSREVNNLFALLGILFLIGLLGPWTMNNLMQLMAASIQNAGTIRVEDTMSAGVPLSYMLKMGLIFLLPVLLTMLILGYLGGIIQNGPVWSSQPLSINLEKISLIAGFKRMFSLKSLAELIKAILKFGLIGAGMVAVMWSHWDEMLLMADMPLLSTLNLTWRLMLWVVGIAIAIMFLLAVADYLFQRFQYIKQHRMSRQELKDEFRESEGDPHIKQRQRQIRQDRMRKRMMSAVPKADVIVTNPTHYSIALRYNPDDGDAAPRVLAKGVDHVAMRIREVAREHNIPLYEDPPLARALYAQAEIDQEIPLQLYEVVAKVIAFVMDLKRKRAA